MNTKKKQIFEARGNSISDGFCLFRLEKASHLSARTSRMLYHLIGCRFDIQTQLLHMGQIILV